MVGCGSVGVALREGRTDAALKALLDSLSVIQTAPKTDKTEPGGDAKPAPPVAP